MMIQSSYKNNQVFPPKKDIKNKMLRKVLKRTTSLFDDRIFVDIFNVLSLLRRSFASSSGRRFGITFRRTGIVFI